MRVGGGEEDEEREREKGNGGEEKGILTRGFKEWDRITS